MLNWKWIQVGVIIDVFVGSCTATNNYTVYSNASTSTPSTSSISSTSPTALTSTPTTSDTRGPITECVATIDESYLIPPRIATLPPDQQISFLGSVLDKLNEYQKSFAELQAEPTITDPESYSSRNNVLFETIQEDITSIFGPAGQAILSFAGLTTDPCLYSTCLSQFFDQSSSFYSASKPGRFIYFPSAPCCGQCTVYGSGVELEYWPTPAPVPPVSILIDEAQNLTYVSPSVYARFTSINARDNCGPIGGAVAFTRIPFDPDGLSTSYFPADDAYLSLATLLPLGAFTKIEYAEFDSPKCLCTTNCPFNSNLGRIETNLCKPQISIPAEVSAIDPAWGACAPNLFGFFDPPIALPRANGLTGPKTTPAEPTPPGPVLSPMPTVPSPVGSPSPPIITPTPSPNPEPETTPPPSIPESSPSEPPPVVPGSSSIEQLVPAPESSSSDPAFPPQETTILAGPTTFPDEPPEQPTTAPGESSQPINTPSVLGASQETTNAIPTTQPPGPTIVIGTQIFTIGPAPSTITSGGSTFVVGPTGVGVIVDGSTSIIATPDTITAAPTSVTINGEIVTANSESNFVIGTQTLTPGGPAITVSGTVISLAPGATELVVGTSTTEIGSIIASFVSVTGSSSSVETGTVEGTSTGPAAVEFTGEASKELASVRGIDFALAILALMLWL